MLLEIYKQDIKVTGLFQLFVPGIWYLEIQCLWTWRFHLATMVDKGALSGAGDVKPAGGALDIWSLKGSMMKTA